MLPAPIDADTDFEKCICGDELLEVEQALELGGKALVEVEVLRKTPPLPELPKERKISDLERVLIFAAGIAIGGAAVIFGGWALGQVD